jgi:hypothetical protein
MKKLVNVMLLASATLFSQEAPANRTLKVTIADETPSIQTGAPLQVNVTLTNISDNEVNVSDAVSNMTGQRNNYLLEVTDGKGNKATKRTFNHEELASWKTVLRSLKPQESLTDQIDLSRQYLLNPGTYSIRVVRVVPKESGGGYAVSNPLTVEVTAPKTEIQ